MRTRDAHTAPLELAQHKPGLLMQRGPTAEKRVFGGPETTRVVKAIDEYHELCGSEGWFGDL